MPLYYFDVIDGGTFRDDSGTECVNREAVRQAAISLLPDIVKDQVRISDERRVYTVVVRNEKRCAVYTATLGYAGLWLDDEEA